MAMTDIWKQANIDHLSASQLLRTPAKWVFDYLYLSPGERMRQGVGWRAHLGSACHDAMQNILCDGLDFETSIKAGKIYYDDCISDEGEDMRVRLRQAIPGIIENGTRVLSDGGFANSTPEQAISVELPGVAVPVIGFIDMMQKTSSGGIVSAEIKTKGPKKTGIRKDGTQGWGKASIPKKPEWSHVCQSAIYNLAVGGDSVIAYAAEHDAVIFTADNCDELKPSGLAEALEEMRQRALLRQNLLTISTDPKQLTTIIDPDWRHMYQWKIKDEFLARAKELWQQ